MYTTRCILLGLFLVQLKTKTANADTEGWKTVIDDYVEYDLENFPIEVLQTNAIPDGAILDLYFKDKLSDDAGDLNIHFDDPNQPTYELYGCTETKTPFPTEFPIGVNTVVKVTLSRDNGERRIVIHADDKEVLNVVPSDTFCDDSWSNWRSYWDLEVTQLSIYSSEASHTQYRPAPCKAGDYMTESGCTACPDGKISDAGSSSEADCKEEDVEDKKQDYSGAILNSLSGIFTAFLLTLLI